MYGVDKSEIKRDKYFHHHVNFITVSPKNEYKNQFLVLSEMIEKKFTGYKFLPDLIGSMQVHGLFLPGRSENNTIFDALFGSYIKAPIEGNSNYKEKLWLKKEYNKRDDPKWIVYPDLVLSKKTHQI